MMYNLFTALLLSTILITQREAERIGSLIWKNECACKVEHLTWWKEGESFPSFGIGHFIWHPSGVVAQFEQQFPEFLEFAKQESVPIPKWLEGMEYCPWLSREEFLQERDSPQMIELRHFLLKSFAIQARFIAQKLEDVLPKMLSTISKDEQEHVSKMFYTVFYSANGIYALADYLNFKGNGCSDMERYENNGWGLLQVLQNMRDPSPLPPIEEFSFAAKAVLLRRVLHAPRKKYEVKLLYGWYNRIDTYIE